MKCIPKTFYFGIPWSMLCCESTVGKFSTTPGWVFWKFAYYEQCTKEVCYSKLSPNAHSGGQDIIRGWEKLDSNKVKKKSQTFRYQFFFFFCEFVSIFTLPIQPLWKRRLVVKVLFYWMTWLNIFEITCFNQVKSNSNCCMLTTWSNHIWTRNLIQWCWINCLVK